MPAETLAVALPRATPESVGLSSQAILDLLADAAAQGPGQEFHSLMVVRHGCVVAEGWWHPYRPESRHLLYSLSKSFLSTAIGLAVKENRLSLDDQVISFFADETPPNPSANLSAMRVRHLLSMSTGQAEDTMWDLGARGGHDWPSGFLTREVPYEPGTHFLYNSSASFMLSAILQKLTGVTALEYLRPRLLERLGIGEATWKSNPDGINVGGWGMSVSTESIAKFGQLYLQDGMWNGCRLLPEGWVAEATRSHIDNGPSENADWGSGYGFQFWRCKHDCYRGDGAFGQLCVVIPQADMVVAATARVEFIHLALDLVWTHLLSAAKPEIQSTDQRASNQLVAALANLSVDGPSGERTLPLEAIVSGRTFSGSGTDIESMTWRFSADGCRLSFRQGNSDYSVLAGRRVWTTDESSFENSSAQPVAASGAWTSPDTYTICLQYLEEPASTLLAATFAGKRVLFTATRRGRFLDSAGPRFEGSME